MGIMIEHFAGIFPLWLAPEQVRIVPVGENFNDYAETVYTAMRKAGLRAKLDVSTDTMGKKIRNAETEHANYILVVGDAERTAGTVAVRDVRSK
jgi:threonyl-tRNA synthetase